MCIRGRKLQIDNKESSIIRREENKNRHSFSRKMMKNQGNNGSSGNLSIESEYEDETIASFRAKEEEIEKKKMEVKEKVEYQLGRAEEETRRLAQVWNQLEVLGDPMKKEVAVVRKKIDITNRDLKLLGQSCQKKEKEYKETLEVFHEKNNEKAKLTTTLVELVKESERLRMSKLEELTKIMNSTAD